MREAITAANNDAAFFATAGECPAGDGPDAITLPAGIYTLGSSLSVSNDVSITGAEGANTVVQAANSPGLASDRVFEISQPAEVTISNITVRHGNAINGGGIKNFGTLTLINSTVSFNSSTGGPGGGIYNASGSVTLIGSVIGNNTTTFDGAGVYNAAGTLSVINSTIRDNSGRHGGGIKNDNGGLVTLIDSSIRDNDAGFGFGTGGGIWNTSLLVLDRSTVSGNTASMSGGGIYTNSGSVTSTNSTLSGNQAGSTGGGAIYNFQATTTLLNTTVADNSSLGGSIRVDTQGTLRFTNTIISSSSSGGDCFGTGTFTSLGHNLDSDGTCGLGATGDISNTGPLIGLLQDNFGPTFTHALLAGSPAIDAGDSAACPATDQRGYVRPRGAACDIGAFELQVGAVTVPSLSQWALIAATLAFMGLVLLRYRLALRRID